jgi:hypothetical protein
MAGIGDQRNLRAVSWDLEFVPPAALPDVAEWLAQERAPDEEQARRHGEAVVAAVPGLELAGPFEGAFQVVSQRDDVPLTIDLDGHSAVMNVAYWQGVTQTSATVVAAITATLAAAGPFTVFDPQDGAVIASTEVGDAFRHQHPKGAAIAARIMRGDERPWYRRRSVMIWAAGLIALGLHRTGVL